MTIYLPASDAGLAVLVRTAVAAETGAVKRHVMRLMEACAGCGVPGAVHIEAALAQRNARITRPAPGSSRRRARAGVLIWADYDPTAPGTLVAGAWSGVPVSSRCGLTAG